MGYMVDGTYHVGDDISKTLPDGQWERQKSTIRNWITSNGSAGPTGEKGFKAEPDRYHLYVAWNCPWAHRTLLARKWMGLEQQIGVSYALPYRDENGWIFADSGEFSDPLLNLSAIHELYSRDPSGYTGRLTVPVLWDKHTQQIVNNESADIVRMLGSEFERVEGRPDLYPAPLRDQIEAWHNLIYPSVNNGVYRAGFARSQEAYEQAACELFDTLGKLDAHLSGSKFLAGDQFTEADLRLFPTLARFDCAYHYAFKCNLKRLSDYASLWPYARAIYQMADFSETVRFDVYKRGYHSKSELRNPLGIVPIGPIVDWDQPHHRE